MRISYSSRCLFNSNLRRRKRVGSGIAKRQVFHCKVTGTSSVWMIPGAFCVEIGSFVMFLLRVLDVDVDLWSFSSHLQSTERYQRSRHIICHKGRRNGISCQFLKSRKWHWKFQSFTFLNGLIVLNKYVNMGFVRWCLPPCWGVDLFWLLRSWTMFAWLDFVEILPVKCSLFWSFNIETGTGAPFRPIFFGNVGMFASLTTSMGCLLGAGCLGEISEMTRMQQGIALTLTQWNWVVGGFQQMKMNFQVHGHGSWSNMASRWMVNGWISERWRFLMVWSQNGVYCMCFLSWGVDESQFHRVA